MGTSFIPRKGRSLVMRFLIGQLCETESMTGLLGFFMTRKHIGTSEATAAGEKVKYGSFMIDFGRLAGVTVEQTQFDHLVASLDAETLSHATDILCQPPEKPYTALKERLLAEFEFSQSRKVKTLIEDLELGDKSPSMLLRKMKELSREHMVSGQVGSSVVLPCEVDTVHCGRVYVITWTKRPSLPETADWSRVYLYSDTHSRPMGDLAGRAHFGPRDGLHLRNLGVADEGIYKCDVTYVHGKCPSLTLTRLRALMKPSAPELYINSNPVFNATETVGPYIEGTHLVVDCRSSGGRPPPNISLLNGTRVIPTQQQQQQTREGADGGSDVIATARFVLSRWDLESKIECRVESDAVPTPISRIVKLDVHVSPVSLRLRGPTTPVVAGEMVSLTCTAEGARPPAHIAWFNRSIEVSPRPPQSRDLMSDATWRTSSTLVFVASRHDHRAEFRCEGRNEVQETEGQSPLIHAITLEVLYPPSVWVEPEEGLTVNETGEATLTCGFSANPPNVTEVTWYKQDTPLSNNPASSASAPPSIHLLLRNISRKDTGSYSCHVRNAFGRGNSSNSVSIKVLYPPTVRITVTPSVATELSDAVLQCHPVDGNPLELSEVRWFRDGQTILSDEGGESEIRLSNLTRWHTGNYSCRGLNTAGWSRNSETEYLDLHYPPGSAHITLLEAHALKGQTVTLSCELDDLGHPPANKYLWESPTGEHPRRVATPDSVLRMEGVGAGAEGVYFCAGRNEAGTGPLGHYSLKLSATPSFVRALPPESGAPRNASSVRLVCHVECDPACDISWYRGTEPLKNSKFFSIETLTLDPDPKRNLLRSSVGSLSWSPSHLPASSGDFFDSSTFSCISSGNELGAGVNSSTLFKIEYPPENIYVSPPSLELTEGTGIIPPEVTCGVSSYPPGKFLWTRGEDGVLSHSPKLKFNASVVSREIAGTYTCHVRNSHGKVSKEFELKVRHRPDCTIRKDSGSDRRIVLVCKSSAHPSVTSFSWFRDNVSLVPGEEQVKEGTSYLSLPPEDSEPARYSCVATNLVGSSEPCRLQVAALPAPSGWVLQEENLIIVAGVAGGLLILMLLMVIAAAVVAVRRRMSAIDKPDMDERQNLEVRGCSEVSALCGSLTPPPLTGSGLIKPPLIQEEKKHPYLLSTTPVHSRGRRFLPNNCPDMYRVRDICQLDHVNKAG
ncbi:hemicentin-1-like [Uloborus diversus]|uniref:hemicentin-1-like n=1 Tax=Uloborus diversus TaxID=327109 RepID=UPI0024091F0A|nr:hemicentin-1-like [Uloborus diversus]